MVRELRRFDVRGDEDEPFEVVEIATFRRDSQGGEVQDGAPTMLTYAGSEAFPTEHTDEYRVERTGQLVRKVV